jgi:hypothetical protein
MRTASVAWLSILCFSQSCIAQVSVSSNWSESNGLSVACSHTVTVPAKLLRGFTTIESVDADPREAITKLKALKKSAVDALQGLGVGKDSIKISASKILEWDTTPRQMNLFYQDSFALSPAIEASEYTAVAFVSFDVPVAGKDSDELSLLPYDICKRLRAQAPFESSKIDMFYVGELTEAVINDATKQAHDEALAKCKKFAVIAGRNLKKLVALTPDAGAANYGLVRPSRYSNDASTGKNPLCEFCPAENEVFGKDHSELTRTFSVALRFEIE